MLIYRSIRAQDPHQVLQSHEHTVSEMFQSHRPRAISSARYRILFPSKEKSGDLYPPETPRSRYIGNKNRPSFPKTIRSESTKEVSLQKALVSTTIVTRENTLLLAWLRCYAATLSAAALNTEVVLQPAGGFLFCYWYRVGLVATKRCIDKVVVGHRRGGRATALILRMIAVCHMSGYRGKDGRIKLLDHNAAIFLVEGGNWCEIDIHISESTFSLLLFSLPSRLLGLWRGIG